MSRSPSDPIVAFRCWRWNIANRQLMSTVRGTVWTPCERLTAECLRPRPEGDPPCDHPPGEDCGCGIYAWLKREDVRRLVRVEPDTIAVWGSCSMWGTVHLHETGLRAQHAYPYELRVSEDQREHVNAIRDTYGVEVMTVPVPLWAR